MVFGILLNTNNNENEKEIKMQYDLIHIYNVSILSSRKSDGQKREEERKGEVSEEKKEYLQKATITMSICSCNEKIINLKRNRILCIV